jgi:hypothetical protein
MAGVGYVILDVEETTGRTVPQIVKLDRIASVKPTRSNRTVIVLTNPDEDLIVVMNASEVARRMGYADAKGVGNLSDPGSAELRAFVKELD